MPSPFSIHDVYVTGSGAFLPGDPVGNDEVEAVLGQIGPKSLSLPAHHPVAQRHPEPALRAARRRGDPPARSWPPTPSPPPSTARPSPSTRSGCWPWAPRSPTCSCPASGRWSTAGWARRRWRYCRGRHLGVGGRRPPARLDRRHGRAARGRRGRRLRAVQRHDESQPLRAGGLPRPSGNPATAYKWFNAEFLQWMLSDGAGALDARAPAPPNSAVAAGRPRSRLTSCSGRCHLHVPPGRAIRAVAPGTTWLTATPADADRDGMLVVGLGHRPARRAHRGDRRRGAEAPPQARPRRPRPRLRLVPPPHQLVRVQGPARRHRGRRRARPAGGAVGSPTWRPGATRVRGVDLHHARRGALHRASTSRPATASWPWCPNPTRFIMSFMQFTCVAPD